MVAERPVVDSAVVDCGVEEAVVVKGDVSFSDVRTTPTYVQTRMRHLP